MLEHALRWLLRLLSISSVVLFVVVEGVFIINVDFQYRIYFCVRCDDVRVL
jgi:hypothetical protein